MKKPTASMLTKMGGMQTGTFNDTANILRTQSPLAQDAYGDLLEGVTGTYGVACGFYFTNGKLTERGQVIFVDYDVVLRVDASQRVDLTDKFQLLTKGAMSVSGTFEVYGVPIVGPTAKTVNLKRITT